MYRSLMETGSAECYYIDNGEKVFFTVRASVLYNDLQISGFYRVGKGPT